MVILLSFLILVERVSLSSLIITQSACSYLTENSGSLKYKFVTCVKILGLFSYNTFSFQFGEFPLHIATMSEHKDLVELLLRYGSSVNIVDRDNRSPLMFAAKCGSMALVQLFLEYGAQCAVMDSNGK
jgi:ankyrin repeat protein